MFFDVGTDVIVFVYDVGLCMLLLCRVFPVYSMSG